jgi:hypothetical protein
MHHLRRSALAVLALAFACVWYASARAQSIELAVKATFLLRFGDFVGWPAEAFNGNEPLRICVLGPDPFGTLLNDAVAGQKVQGRDVAVVDVPDGAPLPRCHMIYVQSPRTAQERLGAIRGMPVLTVFDTDSAGGIINFVIDKNRVRFAIDPQGAATNRLTISSKLLALAVNLKP